MYRYLRIITGDRYLVSAIFGMVLLLASCTGGSIDPTKVNDALKVACGILVPASTIVTMFNLDPTLTVSAIVNVLCTGLKTTLAERKLAASAGNTVNYVVVVNGKEVPVTATVQ